MKRLVVSACTIAALSMGLTTPASAQEILVVDFETFDVDEQTVDDFYDHIDEVVGDDEELSLTDVGAITLDELLLMAGCDAPEPDCLSVAADFVDGDHLLFGSVERSDDVYMFTMNLFDFETSQIQREIAGQTLRGDAEWLQKGMPAIVEHLLYGETTTVDIVVDNAPDADVQLNGESVGTGSTTVDDVAPGEAVVVVDGPDGAEQQRLIVRHDETHTVEFEFDAPVADIEPPASHDAPSFIPGLVAGGAGVAGALVGFVGQIQLASADARADAIIDGRSAVEQTRHQELQQLEGDLTRANTMRWVGFGTGIVGLVSGGFLLYRAAAHDAAGQPDVADAGDLQFDVGVSADAMNAGVRVTF